MLSDDAEVRELIATGRPQLTDAIELRRENKRLTVERDALRARLAQVERERDDLAVDFQAMKRLCANAHDEIEIQRQQLAEATPIIAAVAEAWLLCDDDYNDHAGNDGLLAIYSPEKTVDIQEAWKQARAYTAKYGATDTERR